MHTISISDQTSSKMICCSSFHSDHQPLIFLDEMYPLATKLGGRVQCCGDGLYLFSQDTFGLMPTRHAPFQFFLYEFIKLRIFFFSWTNTNHPANRSDSQRIADKAAQGNSGIISLGSSFRYPYEFGAVTCISLAMYSQGCEHGPAAYSRYPRPCNRSAIWCLG